MAEQTLENSPAAAMSRATTKSKDLIKGWMEGLPSLTEPVKPAAAPSAAPEPPAPTPTPTALKPPEPPASAPADSDEEKWPRDAKDWEKFKAKRKERETALSAERDAIKVERDRLNSEIATLKKAGPSPELDAYKKERDDLSERLRMADIEKHPKFKQYYDGKVSSQIGLAKAIVGKDLADQVSTLLQMPDSEFRTERLNDLVSNLSVMQQSRIGSVLNSLEEINAERASEIDRAKTDYEKVNAVQRAEQERAQQDAAAKAHQAFESIVKSAQDPQSGLLTFQKRDGDSTWNNEVESRIQSAKDLLFGKTSPETMIQAAIRAVSVPALLASHKAANVEIETLKAQVKALTAATPGGGGASETRTSTSAPEPRSDDARKSRGVTPIRKQVVDWMSDLHRAADTMNRPE